MDCGQRALEGFEKDHTRDTSNCALLPLPYTLSAPFSPTAFGRLKIQFCQAVRRPKMRVSIVSGPLKRRFASRPVSASGDMAEAASRAVGGVVAASDASGG